jgi:hypothetical protein
MGGLTPADYSDSESRSRWPERGSPSFETLEGAGREAVS